MIIIKKSNGKKLDPVNLIVCILFFGMLVILPLITVIMPKESFSDMENKSLQSMPKFSTKSLFDGSYTDKLETYISDHFAGRVSWISLKSQFEYALGKREQKGIYILKDRFIEKIDEPDYTSVDKNLAAVNKFASENDVPVYMMIVPTSAEFYKNEMPSFEPNLDQREFINYVYKGLDSSISTIDVYQTMQSNSNQYIYYRTDHHWTSLGAYIAYNAAGKKMGYTPADYSEFDIEHASTEFKGTFYSKALYNGIEDDVIDIYHPTSGENVTAVEVTSDYGVDPAVYDSMYFRNYLDVKDKYSTFLGTNQPIVTIKTNNPDGRKLLIIKDSYAHCYAPFLTQNYSEITLLDLRYIQISYKSVIDVNEYDQVLFLYNASSFSTDTNLRKLGY